MVRNGLQDAVAPVIAASSARFLLADLDVTGTSRQAAIADSGIGAAPTVASDAPAPAGRRSSAM